MLSDNLAHKLSGGKSQVFLLVLSGNNLVPSRPLLSSTLELCSSSKKTLRYPQEKNLGDGGCFAD